MENRFSSIVFSLLVHLGIISLLVFSMNFSVPTVPEKFKVMVYDIPKASSKALKKDRESALLSDKDASGASRLGEENNAEPLRGLKKGINSADNSKLPIPRGKMQSPTVPPMPNIIEKNRERRKQTLTQKGVKEGIEARKNNGKGIFKAERRGIDRGNGEKEKRLTPEQQKELEKFLAAVRKNPSLNNNRDNNFLGLDSKDLSKFAGIGRGFGGEDEEGEGGKGLIPSTGKVVSLNTKDFKYFSYFRHLKELIEGVWVYPKIARERGIAGNLVIQFTIDIDGNLTEAKVIRSSGYFFLDDAALKALHDASPFPPLPKRWNQDSVTIAGSFTYYLNYMP